MKDITKTHKLYIVCSFDKSQQLAKWLRNTYIFHGPANTRDGYYYMSSGCIEVEVFDPKIELMIRLWLDNEYEVL